MNKTKSIVVTSLMIGLGLASCNSGGMRRNPGKIYAPDMTYSRAYDAYTENLATIDGQLIFADSMSSRKPVEGTVAMGHQFPDHLVEGDTNAYKLFTTDMRFNAAEMTEGKRLFNIYCGICHGNTLDGNGPLYADGNGKFAAKPANFNDQKYKDMSVGTMYAAVKYGKGMMGSYASQIDIKQRWMIIAYIKKVQGGEAGGNGPLGMTEAGAATDTAKAMSAMAEPSGTTHH